jgi:hypothetical protein
MSTTPLSYDDILRLFQETDRQFKETDRQFKETSRQLQENERQMRASREEYERQFQETDRRIKEVTASIGRLGSKLGAYVEEMVYPAAVRLFQERQIDVHEVHRNVHATRAEGAIEIDLLVVNDSDVVAIECKSTLKQDDVDEHLERLDKLKRLLPTYAQKRVMGAVTGMVMPEQVAQYAYRRGLFVIAQSGDQLTIRNDAAFQPRIW